MSLEILLDGASLALLLAGAVFFAAGTLGLLRFPDVYCGLHALAKADTLGLGLTIAALLLQADSVTGALKLGLIWALAVTASATIANLFAALARRRDVPVWRKAPVWRKEQ